MLLFGETIDWRSKIQSVVSLSSTEEEFYAAVQSSKTALLLRILFYEIQNGKLKNADQELTLAPLNTWVDNQSTIAQVELMEICNASRYIQVIHF